MLGICLLVVSFLSKMVNDKTHRQMTMCVFLGELRPSRLDRFVSYTSETAKPLG